jgi:hypothetical protein
MRLCRALSSSFSVFVSFLVLFLFFLDLQDENHGSAVLTGLGDRTLVAARDSRPPPGRSRRADLSMSARPA